MSRPTVFLDRDGVLCREQSYIVSAADMKVFDYSAACIQQIHEAGYLAIVVTNQSAVARGMLTVDELERMNAVLRDQLGVDAVYYCPHHEKGVVAGYVKRCNCRKPLTGMIDQACRDFEIDLLNSMMVGDRAGDILLGKNAGLKTVLLESGYGTARLEQPVTPDYILHDLRDVITLL